MDEQTDKFERLLDLTAQLLHSERPLSAAELRDKVPGYPSGDEAFHQMFARDKRELREMGVPLEVTTVPGTDPPEAGYVVNRERYELADPGLEPDELEALQLALATARFDPGTASSALWKLGGLAEPASGAPVPAGLDVGRLPTDRRLAQLFGALREHHPVTFRYRGELRRVRPLHLRLEKGSWYLRAHDEGRDDDRTFRLDRLEGPVTVLDEERFEPPAQPATLDLTSWMIGDEADPEVTAQLRVDAGRVPLAVVELGEAALEERHADGSATFAVTVRNRAAFRSYVLSYLEHAELLGPEELRADLVAWLRELATQPPGPGS